MGRVQVDAFATCRSMSSRARWSRSSGPSGSGKTTMMNILGCLDRPTAGRYELDGTDVGALDDDALARIRSRTIGFVFQSYNLLPRHERARQRRDAAALPGRRAARSGSPAPAAALERLGLGDRLDHEPTELSGGEQQRVALARALVTEPALVLADEPTGNLDTAPGREVLRLLRELHAAGRTIVLITHNPEVARRPARQVHLRDGAIVDEGVAA